MPKTFHRLPKRTYHNSNPANATTSSRHCVQKFSVDLPSTLLDFLSFKLQNRSKIKNLLRFQCIRINQQHIVSQFDYPLHPGDIVEILSLHDNRYGLNHPLLRILYEDDFFITVYKESGLHSVDSTHGGIDNACDILQKYIQLKKQSKRIYIVHRLDRDTSGVMIFAKCREVQQKFIDDWNERILERKYIALVEGTPNPSSGTVDSYLYEDAHKIVHCTDNPNIGLHAVTHYHVIQNNSSFALLECSLETGRTNQIRVHMQSIGHPLVGDMKYHAKTDIIHRLALHARSIKFYHPITGKLMSFEVPEPDSFHIL